MANGALRIGLLTSEYPNQGYSGGIGSYVRQMAHSFARLGHSARVLLSAPSRPAITWDGLIPILGLDPGGAAFHLPAPLGKRSGLIFARKLAAVVEELGLDVVEAPEFAGLTAFLSLVKPRRVHVVVRLHTCTRICRSLNVGRPVSLRRRLRNGLEDWLETRAIETADSVTAISNAMIDMTQASLGVRRNDIHVIANPVNDVFFSNPEHSSSTESPLVLFVGRLEWRKGPDLLIRSVPKLLACHPHARFCFVGSDTNTSPDGGSMLSYLLSLIPEAARSHVEFPGVLGPEQLLDRYEAATVCVFPSRWEGFGLVAAEAMACGKAVVVSDTPGFRDFVMHNATGLLANIDAPEAFASAIDCLLSDHPLRERIGAAARNAVSLCFRSDAVAHSTLEFYKNAIAKE